MAPHAEQPEKSHVTPCNLAVQTATRVDNLEDSDTKQWTAITALGDKIGVAIKDLQDKYINRLPLWATFMITGLSCIVTGFIVAHFAKK